MKIAFLVKDTSGTDYHRLLLPAQFLDFSPDDIALTISKTSGYSEEDFQGVDVVVFSRTCPFDLNEILQLRKQFGFKLVVDIDDYWLLYPTHFYFKAWEKYNVRERILDAIRHADVITTTHEKLAEKVIPLNDHVYILPNALPYGYDQFCLQEHNRNNDSLLYVAGITHHDDLKSISPALVMCNGDEKIQRSFRFRLAGYSCSTPEKEDEWKKITWLASKFGKVELMPFIVPSRSMKHYRVGAFCIAPLEENEFNQHKSNLKILEAGANALPILVSDMHPYNAMETTGVTICKTQRDWYRAILRYATSPEKRIEEGYALLHFVKNHFNLHTINKKRMQLFRSLCSTQER